MSACGGKVPQTEETVKVTEKVEAEKAETETGSLQGRKICIDPGHGVTSRSGKEAVYPGAAEKKATNVSGTAGRIMTEEELNLIAGLELRDALVEHGAEVFMTRTEHECDMSNIERAEFANRYECDLVIRLHADGSTETSANGMSVLIPSAKRENGEYLTAEITEKSRRAGELILSEALAKTGAGNRGIVERPDMTGFNWSRVPVVLIEMGFMTNAAEEERLTDAGYRNGLIDGIVSGTEKYFAEAE